MIMMGCRKLKNIYSVPEFLAKDFEENKTKIIESFWAPAIYTSKENCSYVSQSEASGVAAPHGAWSCKISAS